MPAVTRGELARLALSSPAPAPAPAAGGSLTTTLASDETASSDESTRHSQSQSDSDDESDSDEESDDDDEEEEEEDEDEDGDEGVHQDLNALLLKAKLAARQHTRRITEAAKHKGDDLAGNEEMVLFGSEEEQDSDDDNDDQDAEGNDDHEGTSTPKASSSSAPPRAARPLPPSLAAPLSRSTPFALASSSRARPPVPPSANNHGKNGISLAQDLGTTVLADQGAVTVSLHPNGHNGKGKEREMTGAADAVGDKWGKAPLPRLSKKQIRAKQPHTAGAQWFNLPATPMTPEIKREIDALRLSNQLDPKKFLRGGAKKDKVGEFFQIGHIIAPSTRATTLSSQPTVQKRSFVEDLLQDEEAKAYAKKKTKEVMRKTMSGRQRQRKGNKGAYAMGEGGNKGGGAAGGGKKRKF
ncbi:hypothetical protein JCM3774_004175 [Rhodotorula dairenensis]